MKTHFDMIASIAKELVLPTNEATMFFWRLVNEGAIYWHPYRGYAFDGYVDLRDLYVNEYKEEVA